ncbi:MAG TPA: sigma-70 family RNA polymerase sigma factor [Bryobacteraceae bacterium]|jgi:RNA polymerase sigma-70 factor (ECF subfamily)|nr:sigma-70 family RNA polymerase sigma factor [Bryobacteraceae bacterium]
MISDEELLRRYRRGSGEAFAELFARYREPLFGFFYRRVFDRERAEDLAQEVFVAVMKARDRYDPRAPVRGYLYGIALKMAMAERRKQAFRKTDWLSAEPGAESDYDSSLAVRKALSLLQESEREMVMLREYEQLSYAEMAVLLDIPVNTVRSRLFRARMQLKRYLEPVEAALGREDGTCS